jgi:transcriptional regulator
MSRNGKRYGKEVCGKIIPTEIFIKQKLSQNRKEHDFRNIISNLENGDENGKKIAEKMKLLK